MTSILKGKNKKINVGRSDHISALYYFFPANKKYFNPDCHCILKRGFNGSSSSKDFRGVRCCRPFIDSGNVDIAALPSKKRFFRQLCG